MHFEGRGRIYAGRAGRLVVRSIGFATLFAGAYWTGIGQVGLGTVLVTQPSAASPTSAPSAAWAFMSALIVLGMFASTSRSAAIVRTDLVQICASLWAVGWTAAFAAFFESVVFMSPGTRCAYKSCWPGGFQELAVAFPLVVACVTMIVVATRASHSSYFIRATVPAAVFLVLTVVQVLAWQPLVQPLFLAPPPF